MHRTHWRLQQSATPAISGPLQVYLVFGALVLTATAPTRLGQAVAGTVFLALTADAVGLGPLRWLSVPVAFLGPGLLVVLVTVPGEPIAALGPVSVTDAGVSTALDTLTRSLSMLAILAFLVSSAPIPTVIGTLRRTGLPKILVELLLYVYRAIALVLTEAERMHRAATARVGFRNRRATLRTTKFIASTLLVRTMDRVEHFDEALRARGYDGHPPAARQLESAGHGHAALVLAVLIGVHLL
jgi:cobalt/nickel transport system permease protein